MSVKGFVFLMLVAIGAVMISGTLLKPYLAEGMQITLGVAFFTALAVFPAGRWAEKKGWIKGNVQLNELGSEFRRKRPAGKNAPAQRKSTGNGEPS